VENGIKMIAAVDGHALEKNRIERPENSPALRGALL
jgi:hypothetical protein